MESTLTTQETTADGRWDPPGPLRPHSAGVGLRTDLGATVYIVDADAPMRETLVDLIETLNIRAFDYGSPAEFLADFDPQRPGCLVLDVRIPGMSGLDLQRELQLRGAAIPIIFITAHGDVPMCARAMKHGAFEFLEKPFNPQALIDKIQSAIAFDRAQQERRARAHLVAARQALLSEREAEVMDMIFDGASNRDIAAALRITVRTVEAHRARVMDKMRADSIVGLVRMLCLVRP